MEIRRVGTTVLDRFNQVDILVNNAGIIHPKIDLADFDPDLWRKVIDVNLIGPALLTKAVLPSMMTRRISEMRWRSDAWGQPF